MDLLDEDLIESWRRGGRRRREGIRAELAQRAGVPADHVHIIKGKARGWRMVIRARPTQLELPL